MSDAGSDTDYKGDGGQVAFEDHGAKPTRTREATRSGTPMKRQMTFRTNMRLNAAEFDAAEGEDGIDDNGLDFAEFCRLTMEREMGDFTEAELRERFLKLDVTGSGRIEKHEWLRFSLRDSLARSITRIMEIFHAWDDDGSGTIDQKEFRHAIRSLGFSDVSDRDIDHIFLEVGHTYTHTHAQAHSTCAHIHDVAA